MGVCSSSTNVPNYKYRNLFDLMIITMRSPNEMLELIKSGRVTKQQLHKFKFLGLNILYMTEIFICSNVTKNRDLIELRDYLIHTFPSLSKEILQNNIYINYCNSIQLINLCKHNDHYFTFPSDNEKYNTVIIYSDDTLKCDIEFQKYNTCLQNPYVRIYEGTNYLDFVIHLLANYAHFEFPDLAKINKIN